MTIIPYEALEKAIEYLENIKKLYWVCPYCNKRIAPDEAFYEDPQDEGAAICLKCMEEGV